MSAERTIGRYRRWYVQLLRLYPTSYRHRFAEPMAQTFTDLVRDRHRAGRGLHGFALGAFAETTVAIMRENMTQLMHTNSTVIRWGRWVLVTAAVLAVPALAMAFDAGAGDGVSWSPMDFAAMGVLVLGSGLLFEYAGSRDGSLVHRAAVGIAVLAGFGLVWVNLAVGMMDVEPANLLYALVLFVALVGTAVGRFAPRDAARVLFATAGAHAIVAVVGQVAGLGPTLIADAFWIAAWVASGLLFRQAGAASAPAA